MPTRQILTRIVVQLRGNFLHRPIPYTPLPKMCFICAHFNLYANIGRGDLLVDNRGTNWFICSLCHCQYYSVRDR